MADEPRQGFFGPAFRVFIELLSLVAAALLFSSAYLQYKIFEAIDVPFFLVATTEDIVLGGFNVLAITLDFLMSERFWFALPLHALVLAIAVYLATVLARALRMGSARARIGVLAAAIVLMIAARGFASDVGGAVGALFGHDAGKSIGSAWPPLSNVAATPNDILRFALLWAAALALPIGLAIWGARRFWGRVWPRVELVDFARSVGWGTLLLVMLLLAGTTLPGQIARNFEWGKGRVAWLSADIKGQCAGGSLFVVWSGSKAEILRCSRPQGDNDFIFLHGENVLVDLQQQNVRYGGEMQSLNPNGGIAPKQPEPLAPTPEPAPSPSTSATAKAAPQEPAKAAPLEKDKKTGLSFPSEAP